MNTKVHRNATALVVECEQGVTILLEARDCPPSPLRPAHSPSCLAGRSVRIA